MNSNETQPLSSIANEHRKSINPKTLGSDEYLMHYSLPSWNSGEPEIVMPNEILSNKIELPETECILVSRINPSDHRTWKVPAKEGLIRVASTEWVVLTPKAASKIDFIFACVTDISFQYQLDSLSNGTSSSHQRVNRTDFMNIQIPKFDSKIENKIGVFMGAIYSLRAEKIQGASLLQETAEVLFNQWMNGHLPASVGKNEDIQWQSTSLLDLGQFVNGAASQNSETENLPVVKIREMASGLDDKTNWAHNSAPEKYHIVDGDILFSWAATLLVQHWHGQDALLNQHIFKVIPESVPEWFVFLTLRREIRIFRFLAQDGETTMGHITRKQLSEHLVRVPPKDIMEKMTPLIEPYYLQGKSNMAQSNSLLELQRTVLPKLISANISFV